MWNDELGTRISRAPSLSCLNATIPLSQLLRQSPGTGAHIPRPCVIPVKTGIHEPKHSQLLRQPPSAGAFISV